jgi:hypothetical protein
MRRKMAAARFMVNQATDQWPIRAIGKQSSLKQHVIINWKESSVGRIDGRRTDTSTSWETTQESTTRSCQHCRDTLTTANSITGRRTDLSALCIQMPKSIKWCRATESVGSIIGYWEKMTISWGQTYESCRFRVNVQHETKNKLTRTILLNKWNVIFSSMNKLIWSSLLKKFHYFYNIFFWFAGHTVNKTTALPARY